MMLVFSSVLPADPERVWAHGTSLAGINHELWPLLQMTAPSGITDLASAEPPIGVPWFVAPVWVAGVVPYDRMHLCVQELDPQARRFAEESAMLWLKSWRHERSVDALEGGCRITDRLSPVPRVPGTGLLVRGAVSVLFRWRHRRLRKLFGEWT